MSVPLIYRYDRGLRTFLGANTLSNQLFSAKPAIARAFHAARRADNKAGGGANGAPNLTRVRGSEMVSHVDADDYVSRSEFRTLLAYTRQFFELWIMFLAVDSGGANVSLIHTLSARTPLSVGVLGAVHTHSVPPLRPFRPRTHSPR